MPGSSAEVPGFPHKMMEPSFEKLLALLAKHGIKFILVGGLAVTLQGYVRLTEDVDILVEASTDNLQQLIATLSTYGEGCAAELVPEDFDDTEGAVRIVEETEHSQLDVFTVMQGKRYADVLADADSFEVQGMRLLYASKHSLLFWKSRSVREKDRLDALALRTLIADPQAFAR